MKNVIFIVIDDLRKDSIKSDLEGFNKFLEHGTFFNKLYTHAPETF